MFGRGNWAVFGMDPKSHDAFVQKLEDRGAMLAASQMAANAITRSQERSAFGINPFDQPRLDETVVKVPDFDHPDRSVAMLDMVEMATLATYLTSGAEWQEANPLPEAIFDATGYAFGREAFHLYPSDAIHLYGFWFVQNEWKDVSHVASVKEAASYTDFSRPYKFLQGGAKKDLDAKARAKTAPKRSQVPVLVDFLSGRVYIEDTNKATLANLRDLLEDLGIATISVAWKFGGDSNWPFQALGKVRSESRYQSDFQKAAADAARFAKGEREEIDDPELRSLVRDFFAMMELESELWIGLSTPAQVKLHKTMTGIAVQAPTTATELLGVSDDSSVASASITLQERISILNLKKGEERIVRRDTVTFELSEAINLTDVGAALLRGFDLPSFRRDLLREIKKSKQVPSIGAFWTSWLEGMTAATLQITDVLKELLDLQKDPEPVGIQPMFTSAHDGVIESA